MNRSLVKEGRERAQAALLSLAFLSALRLRLSAKILLASSGSSFPSESSRIGHRLQRGLSKQHFFFGVTDTLPA